MPGPLKHRHVLCIPADHPAFAGHFPGRPILPGVVLLDAAVRALAAASGAGSAALWRVETVKFLSPALPGDTLVLEWEPGSGGRIRFTLGRGATTLAKGCIRTLAT